MLKLSGKNLLHNILSFTTKPSGMVKTNSGKFVREFKYPSNFPAMGKPLFDSFKKSSSGVWVKEEAFYLDEHDWPLRNPYPEEKYEKVFTRKLEGKVQHES